MKNLPLLLVALLGVLVLSSCRTPVGTVERENPLGTPNRVEDRRVQTDSRLYLETVSVNEAVVSGDLTRIQVQMISTTNRRQEINYRFEWYDLEGMSTGSPAIWKPQTIMGRETITLNAVAPTPRAKDFRLSIVRK